jgi:rhamnosyltransferase
MLNQSDHNQGSVSIFIPVKNGFPEIKDCINGWLSQRVPPRKILVVDSGSTDGTLEYLYGIPEVEIIQIAPETFNHGLTRNIGFEHLTDEFIIYTVQDARPADQFVIESLLNVIQRNDQLDGICGQQIVPHEVDKNPVDWFRPIDSPSVTFYSLNAPEEFEQFNALQRKNMTAWDNVIAMYRRKSLMNAPFEQTVFGEDMIWAKKILLNGGIIAVQTAARVFHYHHETPDFVFRRNLTTLYMRYKHLGYLPNPEKLNIRKVLIWIKLILKGGLFTSLNLVKWLRYNIKRQQAVFQAIALFKSHINMGQMELDKLHNQWCAHPPSPPKKRK